MEQMFTAMVNEAMQTVAPWLVAFFVGLVGWAVKQLRRLNIDSTVARALVRAAGVGYLELTKDRRGADPSAIDRAVAVAVEFVQNGPTVAPLLPKAGIDADRLEQLIRAEIGKLLATDPSVTVGGPR